MDRALEDCIATIYKTSSHLSGEANKTADSAPVEKSADSSLTNSHRATLEEDGDEEMADQDLVEDDRVAFLHQFFSASLPGSRHQLLGGAGLSLVLSVHHPNPSVRAAAVCQLGRLLDKKRKVGVHS